MKERINQIAQGIIEWEKPDITFSCGKLEETIPKGYVHNYEFIIKSKNQVPVEGVIYSSHPKVTIKQSEINGSIAERIIIEVNAVYAEDVIEGEFYLVSNGGEYRLPYLFYIESAANEKEKKRIKGLETFTALAKQDFEAALRLFESETFAELDFMQDAKKRALYFNLLGGNSDRRALEEFLIGVGVKKPILVDIKTENIHFDNLEEEQEAEGTVELYTEGWGYTAINCAVDVPWLRTKKRRLYLEDFEYNTAFFEYSVDQKKLHAGRNYGRISFTTPYQTLCFEIQADAPMKVRRQRRDKKGWIRIYQLFMSYQNRRTSDEVLLSSLETQATEMMKRSPDDFRLHLLRAWVYIGQKKENMADKVLEWIDKEITQKKTEYPEEYSFMLYLRALISGEETDAFRAKAEIHAFYSIEQTVFLAYLELYMNSAYQQPDSAYAFLKAQFESGGRSPLLYSLACRVLQQNPSLLTELKMFELQILYYGVKNDLITEALVQQILHLSAVDVRHFSISYQLLVRLYEQFASKPLLAAICSLLVKKGMTNPKYQKWYSLGVGQNIGLTSLYEYYLYSLSEDFDGEIPPVVLLAYIKKDDLDERSRRILYTYIVRNYKNDAQFYEAYRERIQKYAVSQLEAGNFSGKMAVLYQNFFHGDIVDDELAKVLPDLLFTKKITTKLKFARRAVVQYAQLRQEISRPVENGTAWIPVYMDSAAVVFEDEYGNRYTDWNSKTEDAYEDEEVLKRCIQLYPKHLMRRLTEAEQITNAGIKEEEQLHLAVGLMGEAELEPLYRGKLLSAIIGYCYTENGPVTTECNNLLLELDYSRLSSQDQIRVTEILLQNGHYKEAYDKISILGFQNINKEKLQRLMVKKITEARNGYDGYALKICHWLSEAGIYNKITIGFLTKYFRGTNEQMYQLLMKAKQLRADCRELPGYLLEQLFFTGEYEHMVQVYNWYIQRDNNISDSLQKAYYVMKCHCYFCGEDWDSGNLKRLYEVDTILLEEWIRMERHSRRLPIIYVYALLQYYSGCETLDNDQKKLAAELVPMLYNNGIWLKSMVDLKKHIVLPLGMEGRNVIEVRKKAERVRISTVRLPSQTTECCEMSLIWPGVFSKVFVMFKDEVLYCYVSADEEQGQREEIRLSGGECYQSQDSRYAKLNQAVGMFCDKRYMNLKEQLKEIEAAEKTVKLLLPLL